MTVLWCIVGVLVLLAIVVLSLRIGIEASLTDSLSMVLRVGPKRIAVYPRIKKTAKVPPKSSPAAKKSSQKNRALPDLTRQELFALLRAVWKAVERVLRCVGRRVRIDPCQVSIIAGGPQPDRVAELYGQISAAVWTVMPRLEQLVHIRDPYIHLDVDFNAPAINVEGKVGAYLRVGDLFAIAFAAAIPLVKWYASFRRSQKARQKMTPPPAVETTATTQP